MVQPVADGHQVCCSFPMLSRAISMRLAASSRLPRLAFSPDASHSRTLLTPKPCDAARRSVTTFASRAAPSFSEETSAPHSTAPAATRNPSKETNATTYLQELRICNFALIENETVRLHPGLNVITGESGSGKSVLVEALGHILGTATAGFDVIRPPATSATVEGIFAVSSKDYERVCAILRSNTTIKPSSLDAPGAETRGDTSACRESFVSLKRQIYVSRSGDVRSRCFINDQRANLAVLQAVGEVLVDVAGQHASLALADPDTQLRLLDDLAGLVAARSHYVTRWRRLLALRTELCRMETLSDVDTRTAMQELVDDVAACRARPREDEILRRRLRELDARRDAAERCRLVAVGLGGDGSGSGGLVDALLDAERNVKLVLSQEERLRTAAAAALGEEKELQVLGVLGIGDDDGSGQESGEKESGAATVLLEEALEALHTARDALDAAERCVRQYGRRLTASRAEYNEASTRLQELQRLVKQHGALTLEQVLARAAQAEADLDAYHLWEGKKEQMESERSALETEVARAALRLSEARRSAATRLEEAVHFLLADLAMPDAKFRAKLRWEATLNACNDQRSGMLVITNSDLETHVKATSPLHKATTTALEPLVAPLADDIKPGTYSGGAFGLDKVEFCFAAGPEEPLRSLQDVASGGEAARLMLAIKAAPVHALERRDTLMNDAVESGSESESVKSGLALRDDNSTIETSDGLADALAVKPIMVFDEIDSGVGSRLGRQVGRILHRMSASGQVPSGHDRTMARVGPAQVLCISHLPQVAAHADHHVCVRKESDANGRVLTRFASLGRREERLQELAAMLGLDLETARQLLDAAQEYLNAQ